MRRWSLAALALLLAAATVAIVQLVTVPAGPPGGCAWGGPCSLDERGAAVSAMVVGLGAFTALAFLQPEPRMRRVAAVLLAVLAVAPFWAHVVVRDHLGGPLPL